MTSMLVLAFACITAIASVSVQAASPPVKEIAPPEVSEKYLVPEAELKPMAPVALKVAVIYNTAIGEALSAEVLAVAADRELAAAQSLDLELVGTPCEAPEPVASLLVDVGRQWNRCGAWDQWSPAGDRGDPRRCSRSS